MHFGSYKPLSTIQSEAREGFLVTGALLPLTLPPTIPLWMVALGTVFGIVMGKEIFGGVGMNVLNPALTARAFLFFAYPAQISGDGPWLPFNAASVEAAGHVASLPDASIHAASAPPPSLSNASNVRSTISRDVALPARVFTTVAAIVSQIERA